MTEESRYPYAGSVGEATLSWKTRTVKNNRPGGQSDHGSYYAILPKQQVRQLGWEPGIKLDTRAREDGILLSRRPSRVNEDGRGDKLSKPPLDQIIQGDVLDVLAKIPSNSVHLAVTSPPYNVGIRYDRYHDEREYAEYRLWLRDVWKELYRVLVRGGRFALETAPTSIADFRPIHTDLTNDARAVGFEFRAEIIWYKQNMTAPRTAWGSFRSPAHPHVIPSWEYVNVLHKQDWKLPGNKEDIDITSQEFVEWSDAIWLIPPATSKPGDHPAAFPEELVTRILRFFSFRGQTILDPFGGTGTVAAVAKRTGRHYILIDHSPEYTRLAEERVAGIRFGSDGRRPKESRTSRTSARKAGKPK